MQRELWAYAVSIEPKIGHLHHLAGLRSRGRSWAGRDFFLSALRTLVGREANNRQLRNSAIEKVVTNTIISAVMEP